MANTVYAESRLYALDYRLVLAVIRVRAISSRRLFPIKARED